MTTEQLSDWLAKELRKAEHALLCRKQGETAWRGGSESHWREICKSTGTRYLNQEERLELANREQRIAARASQDIEAIKSLLELIDDHQSKKEVNQ